MDNNSAKNSVVSDSTQSYTETPTSETTSLTREQPVTETAIPVSAQAVESVSSSEWTVFEPQTKQKPEEQRKALGILAIIFGGLSILFCWTGFIGIIFGLAGFILGIIAFVTNRNNKKILSLVGFILGIAGFVLSILITILLVIFVLNSAHRSSNSTINSSDTTLSSSENNGNNSTDSSSSSSTAPTTGPAFNWTFNDFAKLVVGDSTTGQGGVNYTEVVKKYGNPSSSQDNKSAGGPAQKFVSYEAEISGDNYGSQRRINLTFTQQSDGSYLLADAYENNLGAKNTDIAGTTVPFTNSSYDVLKVGDSSSGQGGDNLIKIFGKYGYPSSVYLNNFEGSLTLEVKWSDSSNSTSVSLEFTQQSNGDNLLSQKSEQGLK